VPISIDAQPDLRVEEAGSFVNSEAGAGLSLLATARLATKGPHEPHGPYQNF
jgi:hypothetical protein